MAKKTREVEMATPAMQEQRLSMAEWRKRTGTSDMVYQAMKKAFGLQDSSQLTRSRFIELKQQWLEQEA